MFVSIFLWVCPGFSLNSGCLAPKSSLQAASDYCGVLQELLGPLAAECSKPGLGSASAAAQRQAAAPQHMSPACCVGLTSAPAFWATLTQGGSHEKHAHFRTLLYGFPRLLKNFCSLKRLLSSKATPPAWVRVKRFSSFQKSGPGNAKLGRILNTEVPSSQSQSQDLDSSITLNRPLQ